MDIYMKYVMSHLQNELAETSLHSCRLLFVGINPIV